MRCGQIEIAVFLERLFSASFIQFFGGLDVVESRSVVLDFPAFHDRAEVDLRCVGGDVYSRCTYLGDYVDSFNCAIVEDEGVFCSSRRQLMIIMAFSLSDESFGKESHDTNFAM